MRKTRTCATCKRLRMFMTVAGLLIIMIYLQPGWATRLAGMVPSAEMLAWGMMVLGTSVFAVRLVVWRAVHLRDNGTDQ